MNSDYDITLHSDDTSLPESERNRFLDSLGLNTTELSADTDPSVEEAFSDEGVVLSSQTDELGLTSSHVDKSPGRSLSVSVGRVQDRNRKLAISVSAGDRSNTLERLEGTSPSAEKVEAPKTASIPDPSTVNAGDLDATLNLECPECGGELVLKRRHLGIEGACVWCHTSIIAAESARDSQVRVYPILGRISPPVTSQAPAVAETSGAVDAPPAPTETNIAQELISGEGPNVETGVPEIRPPFDFDAPHGANDVSQPIENRVISHGFGETLTNDPASDGITQMAGFGTFLHAASPPDAADIHRDPSNSPETSASFQKEGKNPDPGPGASEGAVAGEAFGFSSPTPWGPPSNGVPVTRPPVNAPDDSAPVSLPEAPIASVQSGFLAPSDATAFESSEKIAPVVQQNLPMDFGAAFEPTGFGNTGSASDFGDITPLGEPSALFNPISFDSPEIPINTPSSSTRETPVPKTFPGAFGSSEFENPPKVAPTSELSEQTFDGFVSPAISPESVTSAEQLPPGASEAENSSGLFFHHSPAATLLFGENATAENRSFAMPGHVFSTGSSSEADSPKLAASIEARGLMPGKSWGISEPIGLHSGDDAPLPLEPEREELSPFKESLPSSFENSTFPALSEKPGAAPQIPGAPIQSFSDLQPAQTPTSLQSEESNPPPLVDPTGTNLPNVTSRPLAAKPKVRKGFVVLMVIIVGFASGAALASFVLPVDEYVRTARAFMEQKFTPGAAVQQLPAISPLPPAPVEPAMNAGQP